MFSEIGSKIRVRMHPKSHKSAYMHSKSHTFDGRSDLTLFVFLQSWGRSLHWMKNAAAVLRIKTIPPRKTVSVFIFTVWTIFNCLNKNFSFFFFFSSLKKKTFGGKLFEWFGRIYRGDVMCVHVWCQSWCGSIFVLSVASPISKS